MASLPYFSLSWYRGHRAAGPALLAGVFGGLALGWLIDNYEFGTQPWGKIVMPGLGFVTALFFIWIWYFKAQKAAPGSPSVAARPSQSAPAR
jgi:F0F1-type ATP synthase assembly protein I